MGRQDYDPPNRLVSAGFTEEQAAALLGELQRVAIGLAQRVVNTIQLPQQLAKFAAKASTSIRVSPDVAGQQLVLPTPSPQNMGKDGSIVVFIESPLGPLYVSASPRNNPNGTATPVTVNGADTAVFSAETVVEFISNGIDRWQCVGALPSLLIAGATGASGQAGPTGPQGLPGTAGADGINGSPGGQGEPGNDGEPGPPGQPGAAGAKGDPGPPGADGNDGADGPQGPPGGDGSAGATGSAGASGAAGAPGPPGADGADGGEGPPGPAGQAGPAGPAISGNPGTQYGRDITLAAGTYAQLTGEQQGQNWRLSLRDTQNATTTPVNNYTPPGGMNTIELIDNDPAAAVLFNGLVPPTVDPEGKIVILTKLANSDSWTVQDSNAGSTAANQFRTVGAGATGAHFNAFANSGWLYKDAGWRQLWWNPGFFRSDCGGFVTASGGVATTLLHADGTWGQVQTGDIANDAVTNAKLANMAGGTVKGQPLDGATGDPVDMTGNRLACLDAFSAIAFVDEDFEDDQNLTSPAAIPLITAATPKFVAFLTRKRSWNAASAVAAGTLVYDNNYNGTAMQYGYVAPTTSATITTTSFIFLAQQPLVIGTTPAVWVRTSGLVLFDVWVQPSALSTIGIFAGFVGTLGGTGVSAFGTDALGFQFDTASTHPANWEACATAASAGIVSDTTVAATTNWVRLTITKDGTSYRFWVDGVRKITLASGLPTAKMIPCVRVINRVAATRSVRVGRFRMFVDPAELSGA